MAGALREVDRVHRRKSETSGKAGPSGDETESKAQKNSENSACINCRCAFFFFLWFAFLSPRGWGRARLPHQPRLLPFSTRGRGRRQKRARQVIYFGRVSCAPLSDLVPLQRSFSPKKQARAQRRRNTQTRPRRLLFLSFPVAPCRACAFPPSLPAGGPLPCSRAPPRLPFPSFSGTKQTAPK